MPLNRDDKAFRGLNKRDRRILGLGPKEEPSGLRDILNEQADKLSRRNRKKLDELAKSKADIPEWEW